MTTDKKAIQQHVLEAINREEVANREAARLLNIHPCYISMLKSEKQWDGITPKIWARFEEFHESRGTLREFHKPDDEPVNAFFNCIPKDKDAPPQKEKPRMGPEAYKEYKKKAKALKKLIDSTPNNPIPALPDDEIQRLNKKFEEVYLLLDKAMNDIAFLKGQHEAEKVLPVQLKEGLQGTQLVINVYR